MTQDNADRYQRTPRPFSFVRIRVYRDGQAEWFKEFLEETRDDWLADLGKLRAEKGPEDDEVRGLEQEIRWCNQLLKDLMNGFMDLVGPNGEVG